MYASRLKIRKCLAFGWARFRNQMRGASVKSGAVLSSIFLLGVPTCAPNGFNNGRHVLLPVSLLFSFAE